MILLYSTNPYAKYLVQKTYANDRHYVWCAEAFDSAKAAHGTIGAHVGSTSDPFRIYCDLRDGSKSDDKHHDKIKAQRTSLIGRARKWLDAGTITAERHDEIVAIAKGKSDMFRPLIYVIPYAPVAARVKEVPVKKRASLGREYIIEDLHGSEFDVLEGL